MEIFHGYKQKNTHTNIPEALLTEGLEPDVNALDCWVLDDGGFEKVDRLEYNEGGARLDAVMLVGAKEEICSDDVKGDAVGIVGAKEEACSDVVKGDAVGIVGGGDDGLFFATKGLSSNNRVGVDEILYVDAGSEVRCCSVSGDILLGGSGVNDEAEVEELGASEADLEKSGV